VFELVEEALDQVTPAIELAVDGALDLAVSLSGDVGPSTGLGDESDDRLGIITAIGDQGLGRRQPLDQRRNGSLVRSLSGGQNQPDRQAALIDDGIDLRAQSATRATDGVIFAPFLPPAAC
jgi:hypothetical protein